MKNPILRLAIPNILSNITVPLVGIVDLALMGHLSSELHLNAIAIGGKPFAVGTVNGYGGDVYATQQIVGIVGSIVAGHFYLLENTIDYGSKQSQCSIREGFIL